MTLLITLLRKVKWFLTKSYFAENWSPLIPLFIINEEFN
jgi:hypothetical protein